MSLHGLQLVIKVLYDITIRVVILISDYDLCTVLQADYAVVEELSWSCEICISISFDS